MAKNDPGPLTFSTFHNVINNELTSTAQSRHGINPPNKKPNPAVRVSTQEDLNRAVTAAQQAFLSWSKIPVGERRTAIYEFANGIEANKDMFAKMLTAEQGKPLSQATTEVEMAVHWARTIPTIEIPITVLEESDEHEIIERHTPMGVVGAIVPWNFPVLLAVGKIVPALYTGNTIILKPSPFTPYCDLKLAELAIQYFPTGVFQALSGDNDLGPIMTEHPGIDKISFTGSILTGKRVMASCAKTLKRLTLELGGNDPVIICDDVDIDAIIPTIGVLSFLCSSQICMMIKRLYVHEKIYDEFRDKLAKHVQDLKVGEGTRPDTFIGPVQNSMQFDKAKDLFDSLSSEGLKPVPTLVDNPPDNSRVVVEEPFAPILPLLKWSDENDVIARANDSQTGLGASVWSSDIDRANRMALQLQAGSVWVNSHFQVAPNVPFGGHKASSIGMEWGLTGLLGYCNTQSLWLKKK
ncbi:Aldehyde dehydrogenase [Aspergillus sclerotialis]|uniref:aldehyde dehydrogenase (NAD(+)) n=1 Tax=Aspergillus sclerotialis TaxID=2070753 RepID=A0A3A2ZDH0_9EURO|nr:Aldehyde dehydrogenase [Aspergillus sclerotialis]